MNHDLYKTGDKDAPRSIKDGNGDVVLGLCRRCGKGECDLEQPCWVDDSDPHSAMAEVMEGTMPKSLNGKAATRFVVLLRAKAVIYAERSEKNVNGKLAAWEAGQAEAFAWAADNLEALLR